MRAEIATVILLGAAALGFRCPSREGLFPNPFNCETFYKCSNWRSYLFECPAHLHFDRSLLICDWPENAGCTSSKDITTTYHPTEPPVTARSGPMSTTLQGTTVENLDTSTGRHDHIETTTEQGGFDTSTEHSHHQSTIDYDVASSILEASSSEPATKIITFNPTVVEPLTETITFQNIMTASGTENSNVEIATSTHDYYEYTSMAQDEPITETHNDICYIEETEDVDNSSALYWAKWRYGEIMPHNVIRAGERIVSNADGTLTTQYSTFVKVLYNYTSIVGTTMGPSGFTNGGIYFEYNGQIHEQNYQPTWILCRRDSERDNYALRWVATSTNDSCPPEHAVSSDGLLLARAPHHPEESLVVPAAVHPGAPLVTAFKDLRVNDNYDVLVAIPLAHKVATTR